MIEKREREKKPRLWRVLRTLLGKKGRIIIVVAQSLCVFSVCPQKEKKEQTTKPSREITVTE
jgi:hypothetical protein